ncbi:transcriptional regulator, GntR family [Nitratireductor aquibiodomus]|uniref:Transcriptional regulator, GntR family n=1 Tax=Nitratireductor aquibiodomus TaxID=204799 RepID=A0A1H4JC84_9HYPH|nr:UTRA domain-containing protein [Nitratireductor aquibiodomus]SEB43930.1 transcriptional regulator, GntR family [Nitratireductor aquibiodomus]
MGKLENTSTRRAKNGAVRRVTLREKIQTDLETRILSGQWHTGYRIPTEKELSEHYACSRITVSKVLMLLAQKGLIETRKRAGSFVRRPIAHSIILQILDPASVAEQAGLNYRYEFLGQVERTAADTDCAQLRTQADDQHDVLAIRCRHHIGDRIYCYEERIINLNLLPEARSVDFETTPPGDWLIDYLPWRSGDVVIGSSLADEMLSQVLSQPCGAAVTNIERVIHANGAAVSYGMAWYAGDMTRLKAQYHTAPVDGIQP